MSSPQELSLTFIEAHPADAARVLERISPQHTAALLSSIPVRLAAPVLCQMLPLHGANCLERLEDDVASGLLKGVGPQAGVALLRYLSESRRNALLAQLPTAMNVAYRLLLGYSIDTVGGWMEPRAMALPADLTAGEALDQVRESDRDIVGDVYVLDTNQRLRGSIDLADLIRAAPHAALSSLMQPPTHALPAQALLTSVRYHAGWVTHRELPVVERGDRLVGVLDQVVLMRALARADAQSGGRPDDFLTAMAGAYWQGISGLIEALISMLPAHAAKSSKGKP